MIGLKVTSNAISENSTKKDQASYIYLTIKMQEEIVKWLEKEKTVGQCLCQAFAQNRIQVSSILANNTLLSRAISDPNAIV